VSDEAPSDGFSGDGKFGWFAYPPGADHASSEDDPWEPPPLGSVIRLMGDYGAEVPLWSVGGLMFGAPEELVADLGVTPDLAKDLATWGSNWERQSGQPDHDAEAARLARRLSEELDGRYQVVYRP
jgi:hypothetical protein